MIFNPTPTRYDIQFRLLGFPVRIHPFFWIIAILLGIRGEIDSLPLWAADLACWISAVFVSVLVHELGHALVFRYVQKVPSYIVLYFGGVTVPTRDYHRRRGFVGMIREAFLSFSGPLAGFLLAGVCCLALSAVFPSWETFVGALRYESSPVVGLVTNGCYYLVVVSIVWGVFNLLPIYPMDGGQISREIFSYFSPRHGVANSLVLSIATCLFAALFFVRVGALMMTILLGYFAYRNYVEMTSRSFRIW